jgi:hypothetical protein
MASVLASQPRNRTALSRSAQIAQDRMIIAVLRGSREDVLGRARKSEGFLARYESSGKVDPAEVEEVVRSYSNISNCYAIEYEWEDVIRLSRHAVDLALAANLPNRAGAALNNLVKAFHAKGQLDEALQASREAVRLAEVPTGLPKPTRDLALAAALVREGEILGDETTISLGRKEEAIAPLERAYALTEDLAQRDPNDSESRIRLFNASMPLAYVLYERDTLRALRLYDHTLSRLAEVPGNPRARRKEAWALAVSTYALRRLGRNAEARSRLNAAMERLTELKLYPGGEFGSEALETLCASADYEAAAGSASRAGELYEELLRRIETAKPNAQTSLLAAVDLNRVYVAYAAFNRRRERADLASALEARRLEFWRSWNTRLPNNAFIRRQLGTASGPFP